MKKQRYRTTIYIGTDDSGKKLYKTITARSTYELKKNKSALLAARNANKNICSNNTFSFWGEKWLSETKKNIGLSHGTLTQYNSAIKHLNNYFSDMPLKDITLSSFNYMIANLAAFNPNTGKPSSKATLVSIKKVAAAIFAYADSNNILGAPRFLTTNAVSIPKSAPSTKVTSLSEDQIQYIIDTPHHAQAAAMIMLFCGLRRGEVFALTWDHINFITREVKISQSVEIIGNKSIVKDGAKSSSGIRTIPIPPILFNYLQEYKNSTNPSDYVCTSVSGKPLTKSSFKSMWNSYMTDLNIKYGYDNKINKFNSKNGVIPLKINRFSPHQLRHTYATLLYLMGTDVVTSKKLLGHSSVNVTIDIYTDLEKFDKHSISDEFKQKLKNEFFVDASFI